ncbi:SdpI family protein [Cellulomonas hominis]
MLWFTLVMGLLIPAAMVACHPAFLYWSRREPNSWSGFRSQLAMKNTRNWQEANRLCGRYWLRWGLGLGFVCLVVFGVLLVSGVRTQSVWETASLVLAGLGLGAMAVPAFLVERRLVEFDASAGAATPSSGH